MRRSARVLTLILLIPALGSAGAQPATAADAGPVVGSWATYQRTSTLAEEIPVLVRQSDPRGRETWTVSRERVAPAPLFVTYSIVRGDATRYVLQVVTAATLDGPPLSVTQVTVERASGKAIRSVTQRPQGVIATPESGIRPFRQADARGPEEVVTVPAGRFSAVRMPYADGTVWVSDQVPALRLVRGEYGNARLELVRSDARGARDLLSP
ncbi:MAG TPA: hypothetical protein VLD61_04560 [Methylomirabilota bacterium]|nr:hypothetical protein [Methylomirabilota bacterium]